MRQVIVSLAVLLSTVVVLSACNDESCQPDDCSNWGGSASKTFQDCVGSVVSNSDGSSSGELILRDASGNEIYRCTDTMDAAGNDTNSCASDFANAKYNYCSS